MDGKETAKRKQVLEGNAFYEIDLECVEQKRKDRKAGKRSTETETVSLKENSGEKKPRGG